MKAATVQKAVAGYKTTRGLLLKLVSCESEIDQPQLKSITVLAFVVVSATHTITTGSHSYYSRPQQVHFIVKIFIYYIY